MRKLRNILIGALCLACTLSVVTLNVSAEELTGQAAREAVFQKMWDMATVVWQPSVDVYYLHSETVHNKNIPSWDHTKVYYGMPYTQSMGSLDRFKSGFVPSGALFMGFQAWIPVTLTALPEGVEVKDNRIESITQDAANATKDQADIIMGNDCSGAAYWALATVAPVNFAGTGTMLPNAADGETSSGLVYYKGVEAPQFINNTSSSKAAMTCADYGKTDDKGKTVLELINKEDMFKHYAKLQKGDVLVSQVPEEVDEQGEVIQEYLNHCMIVESVDMTAGTVTVVQQGGDSDALDTDLYKTTVNYIKNANPELASVSLNKGGMNYSKMSLEKLYNKYYVPLTLPEYETGSANAEVSLIDGGQGKLYLASGTVVSNGLRLESVKVEIKNASDVVVGTTTLYTSTYRFGMFKTQNPQRFRENSMDILNFAPYISQYGLEAGQKYHYTLTANTADGVAHTLNEFTFVY